MYLDRAPSTSSDADSSFGVGLNLLQILDLRDLAPALAVNRVTGIGC